jgi:hypothetical protein
MREKTSALNVGAHRTAPSCGDVRHDENELLQHQIERERERCMHVSVVQLFTNRWDGTKKEDEKCRVPNVEKTSKWMFRAGTTD